MLGHKPPKSQIDLLFEQAKRIEAEIRDYKYKHRPTLPIYDEAHFPQDAIEGQHAVTTGGCYAWYQNGAWHTYCPDNRDPFVAMPTYNLFLHSAKATGQHVVRTTTSGLGNITTVNYATSAGINNGDFVFLAGSAGYCYTVDPTLGTRYEFNSVPRPIISSGAVPIQVVLPGNTLNHPTAQQLISSSRMQNPSTGLLGAYVPFPVIGSDSGNTLNLSEANGIMNWCFDICKMTGNFASGTNIPVDYIIGHYDNGPDYIMGQHGMMGVAFPASGLNTSNTTHWIFDGLVQSGGIGAVFGQFTNPYARVTIPPQVAPRTDHMFVFSLVVAGTDPLATGVIDDPLDFSGSRVTNLGSMPVGSMTYSGGVYTGDWNPYRMYLCARPIAAEIMPVGGPSSVTIDINIPWKSGVGPRAWAMNGFVYKLASVTLAS